mmetsp:Transcript_13663/g.39810  ORF Transcript_13663/g.39810 Transcript_13663/m.39810 type:complete len:259 (-) Transcript_13663:117-893(-)
MRRFLITATPGGLAVSRLGIVHSHLRFFCLLPLLFFSLHCNVFVVLEVILGMIHPRRDHACIFQVPPLGQARKGNIARVVAGEKLVDELVHAHDFPTLFGAHTDLAVVCVEQFEVLVDVHRLAHQAQVEGSKDAHILVVLVFDKLDDDFLLRLQLEHLQHEAQELGGLDVAAVRAPNVLEAHSTVHKGFRRQTEAELFPEERRIDLEARDLLHQILRVCAVHRRGQWVRSVHTHTHGCCCGWSQWDRWLNFEERPAPR